MLEINKLSLFLVFFVLLRTFTGFGQNENDLSDTALNLNGQQEKIVILNSYGSGLPIPDGTKQGIQIALEDGGVSMNDIYFEDLDLVRTSSSEHRRNLVSLLHQKLEHKQIGIVILIGPSAVDFIANEGKGLFPNAAIVALITPNVNSLIDDPRRIMFLPWHVDPAGSVKLALDLFPDTRHVFVITGANDDVLPFLDEAKIAFHPWKDKLDFEYSNKMTYEEMIHRSSSLTNGSIILYSTFFNDKLNRSFVPAEVVAEVCKESKVPVFATLEYYMGLGIMGGALLETEMLGKQAGSIALDYLSGQIVLKDHVTSFDTPIHSMLDWQEVLRFELNKNIPEDCVVVGRPPTIWEQYRQLVVAVIAAFLVLSSLIITLLLWNRRIQQMKNAAIKSEASFKEMIENAPFPVMVHAEGEVLQLSNVWSSITGYSKKDIPNTVQWTKNAYGEDAAPSQEYFEKLYEIDSMQHDGERHITIKNGEQRIWDFSSSPIGKLGDGRKAVISMAVDITDRKTIEEKIKNQNRELTIAKDKAEESERQLKLITDNVVNGMIYQVAMLDEERRRFNYISENVNTLYGCTVQEAKENADLIYGRIHPDDLDGLIEKEKEALKNMSVFQTESRVITPDGKVRWAYSISQPRIIEGIVCWDGIEVDITERKQMELELINAKEKAEESDRLKSAFLANMSHEIRTPMNGILGFTDLLQRANLSVENQKKYINIIKKSGDRLLNTVNDIIEISKIESGEINIIDSRVNVIQHLNTIISFFKPEAETKGLELVVNNDIEGAGLSIMTDKVKLSSILSNLIKNAIKYTEKGIIRVGFKMDKGQILFTCQDSGIGIPRNRLEAIFNRFEQADIDDKLAREGSGLGLTIVKSYVEKMGGKIWVESDEGKGSAFYVSLPNTQVKTKQQDLESNGKSSDSSKKNLHVLIVEDDQNSSLHLSIVAEEIVSDVTSIQNGIEAVETCKNDSGIDLVLMDLKMPGMDGFEATKRIREYNKDIIIIAQSAYAFEKEKQKALDAGCNDFISKPIRMENLKELIYKYF